MFTIKQARQYAGLTQAKMAAALGVCRDKYMKIEKDPESATIGQAKVIARETGVPLEDILFVNSSTLSRENAG